MPQISSHFRDEHERQVRITTAACTDALESFLGGEGDDRFYLSSERGATMAFNRTPDGTVTVHRVDKHGNLERFVAERVTGFERGADGVRLTLNNTKSAVVPPRINRFTTDRTSDFAQWVDGRITTALSAPTASNDAVSSALTPRPAVSTGPGRGRD